MCSAEPPYWITHVNEAWTVLMGHSLEEAKLFCFSLMNVSGWCPLGEGAAEVAVCKLFPRPLPVAARRAPFTVLGAWSYCDVTLNADVLL